MKGNTPASWIISFVVFLSIAVVVFYEMNSMLQPKTPFDKILGNKGVDSISKIEKELSWTVYKAPLMVDSSSVKNNFSVAMDYVLEQDTDVSSIVVFNDEDRELPAYYNETVERLEFLANLSSGKNRFYLVYAKNTSLDKRTYMETPFYNESETQPTINILFPEKLSGLSYALVQNISQESYSGYLENILNLEGVDFYLEIEGVNTYRVMPENQNVFVAEKQSVILDRFGKTNPTKIKLAVWLS